MLPPLQNQIQKKLTALEKLLDKVTEAQTINPDDPETWDSDTLYNLAAKIKEALQLLEDQKSKQLNDWGEPIVLESGLCSLLDDWETKQAEKT